MSDKASEFIAAMEQAKQLANEAAQQANLASALADEGADLFAQGGNANSHAMMTAAAESARRMVNEATAVASTADEAIGQATQAKGLPAKGSAPHRPEPVTRPKGVPGSGGSDRAPRPDMAIAAAVRGHVGQRKTVGRLTVGGEDVAGEIWSGREGPGRGGPGLAAPWRHMETMTEHVEGHVAAVMRRDGIRDAQLYISRRPCVDVPYGCRWQLSDALPNGTRLTVFTVDARGGVKPRIFIGTGKGCSDAAS